MNEKEALGYRVELMKRAKIFRGLARILVKNGSSEADLTHRLCLGLSKVCEELAKSI